jgi:simple sugar transport system substrate-binding protein
MRRRFAILAILATVSLVAAACGGGGEEKPTTSGEPATSAPQKQLVFGMLLVGPKNDHGWSQAHYEAGKELEKELGAKMIVLDKVNPADRPETSVDKAAADMIAQGAQLIFATSDDMKDGVIAAATQNPDVPMIWASGDTAWPDGKEYMPELKNLGNIMGRMEYGKMIAGCAAALTTQTGHIGYLGALINDETRRLANSAYLGARYCWSKYRSNGSTDDLKFDVNWIGFWFNIPGQTLDPTQVTNGFFDSGADVVMSGIDTTESLVRAGQRREAGEDVWAVSYDYTGGCDEAPDACLGSPYFNWIPAYLDVAKSVQDGTFKATFQWNGPDWSDINNLDSSAVGFVDGAALSDENKGLLDEFIAGLGDGSINLYEGPLNYQDGSTFLGDGETATDAQVWYMPQLLEGMKGASSS